MLFFIVLRESKTFNFQTLHHQESEVNLFQHKSSRQKPVHLHHTCNTLSQNYAPRSNTMSVSPFTVQNDFEVQAYNQRRAIYLASEKKRKQEEKALRQAFKNDRRMSLKHAPNAPKSESPNC